MWGRLGSTLTVWDSPIWLVSPISSGSAMFVTSISSRPPWGAPVKPSAVPWSWQRPGLSVASTSSWVSEVTALGLWALRSAPPLGVASTSCWSPSAWLGSLVHSADGWAETNFRTIWPACVSLKIVWPAPFAPTPSVPTDG